MRIEYKGFILVANREKTKMGIYRTFYSAIQKETKMILSEDACDGSIPDALEDLKDDVDSYLKNVKG
jgi:hypothetical protein